MRDRLIELLEQKSCAYMPCDRECGECHNVEMYDDSIESIADHLLANGVIVQKQGELIKTEEPLGWRDVECVECSVCHESWIIDEDSDFEDYAQFWNYCPECGAKLKEREKV